MPQTPAQRAATFATGLAVGLSIGLPTGGWIIGVYDDRPTVTVPATVVTADPAEDDAAFDCRVHGNRICGPGAVLPGGTAAIPGDYRVLYTVSAVTR